MSSLTNRREFIGGIAAVSVPLFGISSPVHSALGGLGAIRSEESTPKPYDSLVQYITENFKNNANYPYIDTGIPIVEEDGYVHDFSLSYRANNPGSWGFYTYGLGDCTWMGVKPDKNLVLFGTYSRRYNWASASGWADYLYDSTSGWYVNGEKVVDSYLSIGTDPRITAKGKTLRLFMCQDLRYGISQSISNTVSVSNWTLAIDGELALDLQACRITNEAGNREGAMYDTVSDMIFRSIGQDAFAIGPDKRG